MSLRQGGQEVWKVSLRKAGNEERKRQGSCLSEREGLKRAIWEETTA